MNVIDYEVEEIQKIIERTIEHSKLIVCMNSLIRVDIKQTESRQITICIRYPSNYPSQHLLVECKSRFLSGKMLIGLQTLAEQRAMEFLGKPQTLIVLKFIDNYMRENPLCIVYDEIAAIKSMLRPNNKLTTDDNGELKCFQKSSSVALTVNGGDYYYKAKFHIPEQYPMKSIEWTEYKSNFPIALLRFLNGQAKEISRKCVERPLRLSDTELFIAKPSLLKTLKFIVAATMDFHNELCPVCEAKVLPASATMVETNDTSDQYVERVYCGHIYHQGCLKKLMREPPFPPGGKLCPAKKAHPRSDHTGKEANNKMASGSKQKRPIQSSNNNVNTCGIRISHDRWALNIKLAEARWAQQQARERELEEVKDFFE